MTTDQYSFERYLNVRSAYAPGFSPDGKRLSFLTDITGMAEVWSVPIDIHATIPAWPDQLTFRGERVTGASYSPTADVLLVSADVGENERTQLYSLSADSSAFIALTTQSEAIYQFGVWSSDGTRITYSSNERDGRYFDIYELVLETGKSRLLLQHDGTNYPLRYSPDGRDVLVSREESNVRNQLLLLDTMTGDIRTLTPEAGEEQAQYEFPGWSADRRGLYLLTNRGRQFLSLAWLDLWAAAVDIVGIANFVTFLENTGPWRRKLRESEYGSLERDREFLEQISPIHQVDRISAPLFVVHGANDPRVPIGEAEQIVPRSVCARCLSNTCALQTKATGWQSVRTVSLPILLSLAF